MKGLRLGNRLTLILLLATLGLGSLLFMHWQGLREGRSLVRADATRSAVPPVRTPDQARPELDRFNPPPRSAFNEILERPLFSKGRLPPEEPVAASAPTPRVQLRLRLEGIASSGDKRIALIRDQLKNVLLRLQQGMSYQGWTLQEVGPVSASLKRGNETSELHLEVDKKLKLPKLPKLQRHTPQRHSVRKMNRRLQNLQKQHLQK